MISCVVFHRHFRLDLSLKFTYFTQSTVAVTVTVGIEQESSEGSEAKKKPPKGSKAGSGGEAFAKALTTLWNS